VTAQALALRAVFIALGAALLWLLSFMFLIFGLLLLWTAVRLFRHRDQDPTSRTTCWFAPRAGSYGSAVAAPLAS
jgi:predicted tellurium resistance membrane protein TerC